MRFSWVILTCQRPTITFEALTKNYASAGRKIDEIVWVDNGSDSSVRKMMKDIPDVAILNKRNMGVARGYNQGFEMSTGTHIVITGCDRIMPDGWLARFDTCFASIPNTGAVSCYSKPLSESHERLRPSLSPIDQAMVGVLPLEARCFPRSILKSVGYLREDFGLYGWEDVEWACRCERVFKEVGLASYTWEGFMARHLGSEGIGAGPGDEDKDYFMMKVKEVNDPKKLELLAKCRAEGWPYYSPF